MPSKLLIGDKPRLFDEWQDAPKKWGTIRKDIDDTGLKGQYILTGSSSQKMERYHIIMTDTVWKQMRYFI
jgi:hypothetical protein